MLMASSKPKHDVEFLDVNFISEVEKVDKIFQNVVMEKRASTIVQAISHRQKPFLESGFRSGEGERDKLFYFTVSCIHHLHGKHPLNCIGPPGVGKTYTVGM
jgi:hypothetical protein